MDLLTPKSLEPKLMCVCMSWDLQFPKELEAIWIISKSEIVSVSHVSQDGWFGFQNNTDVRVELNIFCYAPA